MPGRKWRWSAFAALTIAAACTDVVPTAPNVNATRPLFNESDAAPASTGTSFCNPALIRVPALSSTTGSGPADLFPSSVDVSGIGAGAVKVTATVNAFTHTFAADIDMVLVGPTGVTVMLLSDAGANADFRNTTLTFDDGAVETVPAPPNNSVIPSGTYKPTYPEPDIVDVFPGGPRWPFGSSFEGFVGTDPNGTWQLYVVDDASSDVGVIAEGWCVTITTTTQDGAPTADIGGPYVGDEGSLITFNGSGSTDPDDDIVSYAWTFGDEATGTGPNPQHAYADNGTYLVKLVVTDEDGASNEASTTVTVNNVAPQVTGITLPSAPIAVGTPITIGATFADVGAGDAHTATFDLDQGGATAVGTVVESGGSGSASASVTYTEAGVYTIRVSVTDDDNESGSRSSAVDVPAYIVVYDPSAGFVTGGGWIGSPENAYVADPSLAGMATFGFVATYVQGANTPSGNTEFWFHAGALNFTSTSYDWLVVAGTKAKYKGEGTVNGAGGYGFMLTAIDGDKNDNGGSDAFRIKIWDLATGAVVYDNKRGEEDDSDASTVLGGGSIVVHK
jgi:PKD repeat protein